MYFQNAGKKNGCSVSLNFLASKIFCFRFFRRESRQDNRKILKLSGKNLINPGIIYLELAR